MRAVLLQQIPQPEMSWSQRDPITLFFLFQESVQNFQQTPQVILDAGGNNQPEFCFILNVPHQRIKTAQGNNRLRTGVVQLVDQLPLHVKRVAGGDDAAGPQGPVKSDQILGAVRHMQGHPGARFQPLPRQHAGKRIDLIVQLVKGQPTAHELNCNIVGVFCGSLFQETGQRFGRQLKIMRHAGVITLVPLFSHRDPPHLLNNSARSSIF